jgi:hypothetical protein
MFAAMNTVIIGGSVYMAPREMLRLVDEPRAAEILVRLDPVADYGENVITVRCYGTDADIALRLKEGDWVEVAGRLVSHPAHVQSNSIDCT